ncbi:MAG: hypothetical protein DI598_08370 [Pseudopedobacter saltans]|uniref:DUF4296 domain-containing protein n=1 Tax=Pseudopedobacter saltans TaxID=151895 RepID=A0A2W5F6H1_9SPHI|nr:MAG: hypothetical protein DI598_08370 [Pseudopedobacter saltans]
MIKRIIIVCGLISYLIGCKSDKIPSDVLTPSELKVVVWDLMAAGEVKMSDTSSVVRLHLKDSATAAFSYVLQLHKMSKETFLHSLKYYEAHPDKENELLDTLIAYNDRQVKLYEEKYKKSDSAKNKKATPIDTIISSPPKPEKLSEKPDKDTAKPVEATPLPVPKPILKRKL